MTDWAAVRARLKSAREANGWTQRELAERIGVTTTRVGQIESSIVPSEKVLGQLAEALGRSPAWLRYGVASATDVRAAERAAYAAGARSAIDAVRRHLDRMAAAVEGRGISGFIGAEMYIPVAPPTAEELAGEDRQAG